MAKKRRWAAAILRQFINGFINRNEAPNEANAKFLMFVRHQYLLRLSKQLPKSVLDKSWPDAPVSCQEVTTFKIHDAECRALIIKLNTN